MAVAVMIHPISAAGQLAGRNVRYTLQVVANTSCLLTLQSGQSGQSGRVVWIAGPGPGPVIERY